eukprot:280740-Rhodomonas_salina.1
MLLLGAYANLDSRASTDMCVWCYADRCGDYMEDYEAMVPFQVTRECAYAYLIHTSVLTLSYAPTRISYPH